MDRSWYVLCFLAGFFLVLCSITLYTTYKDRNAEMEKLKLQESEASPEIGNGTMNPKSPMTSNQIASAIADQQCRIRSSFVGVVCLACQGIVLMFAALCSWLFCPQQPTPIHSYLPARIERRRPRVTDEDREEIMRAINEVDEFSCVPS